jgi:hypothetical protein
MKRRASWNAMKKSLWVLIVLCLGAAVALTPEGRADSNVIHADLAFHFVCKEKDRSTLEDDMDNFLRQQGFKVLNQGRVQREHGFFLTELKIIGLDDGQRLIDVTAVPLAQGRYSVGLTTPPPTKRAPQLEDALSEFASKTLGCEVRQVIRGENAADAAEFYNDQIKRVENLFRQAEQLRGERRL